LISTRFWKIQHYNMQIINNFWGNCFRLIQTIISWVLLQLALLCSNISLISHV